MTKSKYMQRLNAMSVAIVLFAAAGFISDVAIINNIGVLGIIALWIFAIAFAVLLISTK